MTIFKRFIKFSDRRRGIAEITPTSVTQGKSLRDDGCCAAAHAVDKDLWTSAITETDNGAGWLELKFDKTYFFHKVVIYHRFYNNWFNPSGGCVQDLGVFMGCVNLENNVDVSVYQGGVLQKSCGTLQLTYGLEQSDQIYTMLCYTEGDTVKLSKDNGHIVVLEVAVTGKCTVTLLLCI